jgi:hypothetical protein
MIRREKNLNSSICSNNIKRREEKKEEEKYEAKAIVASVLNLYRD